MRLNLRRKMERSTEPERIAPRIPEEATVAANDLIEFRGETPEISDETLLMAYRDRQDAKAFESLVQRYEAELFHYLRHYLADATLAEDVFQSTFLAIHTRCGTFEDGRRFRPWLYAVATHQAIDAQRRLRRHRNASLDAAMSESADRGGGDGDESRSLYALLSDDSPDPAIRFDMQEDAETVRQAVDSLPELLRQVVLLVYFQGLRYREAADSLGVPVGTVKSRLHAAMARLTTALVPAESVVKSD